MNKTIDVQTSRDVRKEAQQVFVRHTELLSSGRIPEWVDLFAEDGLLEFPYAPAGFPKSVRGKAALLAYMKNFPEHFQVRFHGIVFHETADPSLVIAEFASEGIARATGRPYNQTYISVVETKDGLITRYRDFWNPLVAMEALGSIGSMVDAFTH
jgi:ketosteroid isomerase-like protein